MDITKTDNPFDDKKLTYYEKQLILYSKGHFETVDLIEDIREIAAKQYTLPVEYTEHYSIYHFVVTTFFKLQGMGYIKLTSKELIMDLFKRRKEVDYRDVIVDMLGQISITETGVTAKKPLDLGDPDQTLFYQKGGITDETKGT